MAIKNVRTLVILHGLAIAMTLIGAVGSFGFMLYAGRNNDSLLLLLLFSIWVLSPFTVLFIASKIYQRLSLPTPAPIYCLMIVVSSGSLIGYYGGFVSPGKTPAFVFLFVPLMSWIVAVITVMLTRKRRANFKN